MEWVSLWNEIQQMYRHVMSDRKIDQVTSAFRADNCHFHTLFEFRYKNLLKVNLNTEWRNRWDHTATQLVSISSCPRRNKMGKRTAPVTQYRPAKSPFYCAILFLHLQLCYLEVHLYLCTIYYIVTFYGFKLLTQNILSILTKSYYKFK